MLRRSGRQRLPVIPIAAVPYEPGSGEVDVMIELDPDTTEDVGEQNRA
jgi:hypothetical protein